MRNAYAWINNKAITAGFTYKTILRSPVDGTIIGEVFNIGHEHVEKAYTAAAAAFKDWSALTPDDRVDYIKKIAAALTTKIDEFVVLMGQEIAKSQQEAITEANRSVDYINDTITSYVEMTAKPLQFNEQNSKIKRKKAIFSRIPIGVVLAISPFNYPLNLAITKIIPALITGNTVIFKPSSTSVLIGSLLAEIIAGVGLPVGVFQMLAGTSHEIGEALLTNKHLGLVNFTGSSAAGKKIAQQVSMRPMILEMGGKDSAIVLDDADLDLTAAEIVKGAFAYAGQRCTAIKRVFVCHKTATLLVPKLLARIVQLRVGLPHENADVCALVDLKSVANFKNLLAEAVENGAKAMNEVRIENNLIYPMLVDHVTPKMQLAWVEPFAPILPIIRVDNVDQMIEFTNISEYGLQASIFTADLQAAESIAKQLNVGTVNINKASSRGPDIFPFLGVKNSGFGVQGVEEALLSVTRYQGLVFNY